MTDARTPVGRALDKLKKAMADGGYRDVRTNAKFSPMKVSGRAQCGAVVHVGTDEYIPICGVTCACAKRRVS